MAPRTPYLPREPPYPIPGDATAPGVRGRSRVVASRRDGACDPARRLRVWGEGTTTGSRRVRSVSVPKLLRPVGSEKQ
jgi:hypothetical protein